MKNNKKESRQHVVDSRQGKTKTKKFLSTVYSLLSTKNTVYSLPSTCKKSISCCLLSTVYCLLLLNGCQQGAPPQPQPSAAPQAKKEAPKPAAAPVPSETKEEKKPEAAVDIKQKNPFKPFIAKAEKLAVVVPKTPLQKYELEQLKVVAIIWGLDGSIAMVEAPDGKGYSVKRGDLVGNRDGRVKRIEKDKIVVEERFTEAGGEVTTSEFELKLPLPKGEEEFK